MDAAGGLLGGIDVVMNNAGLGGSARLVDMTDEQWSAVLGVTLDGTMRCTRAALRRMIDQGTGGAIVNNASVAGWRAQVEQAHYAAAKAGVMALTRCAALEAAEHGIRVNCVAPSLAWHPFPGQDHRRGAAGRPGRQRGLRPARRALGGGQRDGVPGQRPCWLHDRRSGLGQQPAPMNRAGTESEGNRRDDWTPRQGQNVAGRAGRRSPSSTTPTGPSPSATPSTTCAARLRHWAGSSCSCNKQGRAPSAPGLA